MAVIYLQAEEGGPIWRVWPVSDVVPPGSIREGASYCIELRDCDDALAAELLIDDTPIEALRSRNPSVARWRWRPGFHAGVVDALIYSPSIGSRRFEITTDPDLRKLTRLEFDAMIREVLEDTFALFSLSAFRKGIARQPGNRPPALARLEFLRSRAESIVASIEAIARAPRHSLRAEEVSVPVHRATRATGLEIIKSLRSGGVRTEVAGTSRLPPSLRGRLPAQVTLRRGRSSVDIPEHRQIKACLKSWAAWLLGTAELLAKAGKAGDPALSVTGSSWAVRTRQLARRLNDVASAGFMSDVGEDNPSLRMSSLFRNDPRYQRFYRLWQDMNLGLAALFGDFLQMPLAKTYELYELWCFLRLLRAAVEEYGTAGVDLNGLFATDSAGAVTIAASAVTVPIGNDWSFCFQRSFREYWLEQGGVGSFSRTMIPDVVIAKSLAHGSARQLIVLDAKYRIDSGLNEALSSIHTYRDSLVQDVGGEGVEGVVTAAYLLTPHVPPELPPDFKDMPVPGRLFHPEYRGKFRFGAVTLKPGMTNAELRACLRTVVADAVQGA